MSRVSYIWSPELQYACDQLPCNRGRSSMIHDLHRALGFLDRMSVVEPDTELGSRSRLERFHDRAYISAIVDEEESDDGNDFGLEHDCPVFADLADYISLVAAATSTACRLLRTGEADVAIHWDGGRHHAMRNKASGFCYVADIVLGIMLLCKEGRPSISKSKRPRVMYLDLDIHHGDGVARAFTSPTHFITDTERPPQVLTLSVHYSSSVFYPAPTPLPTPDTLHPFTLAMPLAAYPSPSTYHRVYQDCVLPIKLAFDPDYIVLQLGADGLPEDPIGQWGAWSVDGDGGMARYAEQVRAWGVPVCILGGGGYNHPNTARAWSSVTAHMIRQTLPEDIPHHQHFPQYAPSYSTNIPRSNARDENSQESLDLACDTFHSIARRIATILRE